MILSLSPLLIHSLMLLLITFTVAMPFERRVDQASDNDIGVMIFALWAERISLAMLSDGLAKYTPQQFGAVGFPSFVYDRMKEMAQHDAKHVDFLTAAITDAGAEPVPSCEYNFPYQDPRSFLETASILKSITTSMYGGSAAFVQHRQYSTLMASVRALEARHSAWLDSAARNVNPWSTAFEALLTKGHAYTLASRYVSSCPENYPIQLDSFPPLEFSSPPVPGKHVQFNLSRLYATDGDAQNLLSTGRIWVAFLTGEGINYATVYALGEAPDRFEVIVPKDLLGTVYAILTTSNKKLSDTTTIAGPTLLTFYYNSQGVVE